MSRLIAFIIFLILISPQSALQSFEKKSSELPVEPLPLVSADLFKGIDDKVAGISVEESENYYDILNQVQYFSEKLLQGNSQQFIKYRKALIQSESKTKKSYSVFVDMFKNPVSFRGMAVQLKGHARKIIEYPAGKNDYGIKKIYECWLYTEGSQSNPAVIITTEIPEGMPVGEDITNPVEVITVTGVFYRKYIYSARDTMRIAPMILAHKLHWKPVKPRVKKHYRKRTYVGIVVVILIVLLIFYNLGNAKTDRRLIAKKHFIDESLRSDDFPE